MADGTMLLKKIYIFSPVQDAILSSLGSCSSCPLLGLGAALRAQELQARNPATQI